MHDPAATAAANAAANAAKFAQDVKEINDLIDNILASEGDYRTLLQPEERLSDCKKRLLLKVHPDKVRQLVTGKLAIPQVTELLKKATEATKVVNNW